MSYSYDQLKWAYEYVEEEYCDKIQDKNATTFEDSLICENDIHRILNDKFDKIISCFETGQTMVADLKQHFSTTDYENTVEMIENFKLISESYISSIQDINFTIRKASDLAYQEYDMNFKEIEKDYLFHKDQAYGGFVVYDSYARKIKNIENQLNVEGISNELQSELDSKKSQYESIQSNILETVQDHIGKMAGCCSELEDLLENALEKVAAV